MIVTGGRYESSAPDAPRTQNWRRARSMERRGMIERAKAWLRAARLALDREVEGTSGWHKARAELDEAGKALLTAETGNRVRRAVVALMLAALPAQALDLRLEWNAPTAYTDGAPIGTLATALVYTVRADAAVVATVTGAVQATVAQADNTRRTYTVTARAPRIDTGGEVILAAESAPSTGLAVRITRVAEVAISKVTTPAP
jgi:hypothetical protein